MKKRGIDKDVLLLGIVSFLTDLSSEMIFAVWSLFFTLVIGASTALLGLVEGIADFSASSLDYVAGYLSDRSGKRKRYTLLGYGFSTLAKCVLLFATSAGWLLSFRVIERLGKSFRGPPRDAWLASVARKNNRGLSFGLHKAMDKAGAILGPLVAYWLLSTLGQDAAAFKTLFLVAIVPAFLAVIVLALLRDRPGTPYRRENMTAAYRRLSRPFKRYLVVAGIFSLAYFSFSFLLLRAHDAGFTIKDVVLLYALFNISFVVVATPIGALGDRIGRGAVIATGFALYALMCLGFAFATTKTAIVLLFILFGVFYAIDESQGKAFIADLEPKRRATAIGFYNFFTGISYLPASLLAGWLWTFNTTAPFVVAALLAAAALAAFFIIRPSPDRRK